MINYTRWTVPRYYVGPFTRLERVSTCPRSPHLSVLSSYHMLFLWDISLTRIPMPFRGLQVCAGQGLFERRENDVYGQGKEVAKRSQGT